MAHCDDCKLDMNAETTTSCIHARINLGGKLYDRIRYGQEPNIPTRVGSRCSDCNVAWMGIHHWGCTRERCPKCKSRIMSCGCAETTAPPVEQTALPELDWHTLHSDDTGMIATKAVVTSWLSITVVRSDNDSPFQMRSIITAVYWLTATELSAAQREAELATRRQLEHAVKMID